MNLIKDIRPAAIALLISAGPLLADPPVIEDVQIRQSGDAWSFSVTLSHPDTGWDHYADGWRVLAPNGDVLGTRVLHHPHVQEQPFTRSLGGVSLPEGLNEVQVEARDNVDGWTGITKLVPLP